MSTKHDDDVRNDGETIWDRYAAAAMQAIIHKHPPVDTVDGDAVATEFAAAIAGGAAMFADAMIAERRKRGIGRDYR